MKSIFLMRSFELGRATFNPDLWRSEDPPEIWATLYGGSRHKGRRKVSFLLALTLPGKLVLSVAIAPTSWDSSVYWGPAETPSLVDWTATGFLNLVVVDSHHWTSRTTACKSLLQSPDYFYSNLKSQKWVEWCPVSVKLQWGRWVPCLPYMVLSSNHVILDPL